MGSLRGRGGGGGGEKKREEGRRERKRKREQAPLTSHFPSTTPACQPACSLFSFELSILPRRRGRKKKINSYFHNPHSCLSTCLCLPPPSLHPSPSLPLFSVSPSPSLPWGRLTPPPRSYGLQMSLRRATITAQTKGGLALSSGSLCGDCWLLLPYAGQLGPQKRDGDCGYTGATHKGGEES